MKKLPLILLSLISLILIPACSNGKKAGGDNGAPKFSYNKRAYELMDSFAPFDTILAMQDKAIEQLRRGESDDDPVDVLQQTGYFYCRAGKYALGADYLLEAVDSLKKRESLTEKDRKTAAFLYGNLANLYTRMNMYAESLDANAKALEYSGDLSQIFASNLWRMRGMVFQYLEQPDSVMRCYDLALARAVGREKLAASAYSDRAEYMVHHPDLFSRQEILQAMRDLESSPYNETPQKWASIHIIAQGKIFRGDTLEGIKIMERTLDSIRVQQDVEMMQYNEKELLNAYAQVGRGDDLARLFPEYDALCDTLMNREKINSVTASEFRFRTKEKELEARMWKEREASARKIILLQWLAIILAVVLAAFFTVSILRKLRQTRKSKEDMRQRLLALLTRQKEVNATIETLNSRIEELNKEIESSEGTDSIRDLIAGMPSCLLSDEQEALFRRYFSKIYPRFIHDLRRDYPTVTPNDELIAMLIYMKYRSEEIALSLGISKQSVNSARYRLRKKLDLPKETDLDSFLTSRKG